MNEMTGIIQEIITAIKEVSPHVWAVLLKQVQLDAYSNLLAGIILLSAGIFVVAVLYKNRNNGKRLLKNAKVEEWEWEGVFFALLASIFPLGGVGFVVFFWTSATFLFLHSGFLMLYNPEFYAIQYLIEGLQ